MLSSDELREAGRPLPDPAKGLIRFLLPSSLTWASSYQLLTKIQIEIGVSLRKKKWIESESRPRVMKLAPGTSLEPPVDKGKGAEIPVRANSPRVHPDNKTRGRSKDFTRGHNRYPSRERVRCHSGGSPGRYSRHEQDVNRRMSTLGKEFRESRADFESLQKTTEGLAAAVAGREEGRSWSLLEAFGGSCPSPCFSVAAIFFSCSGDSSTVFVC